MEKNESLQKQDSIKTQDSELNEILIDVERISIGQHQADNIQCFLCYRVPFSPLLLSCCEQIICNRCLNDWKAKNSVCPHCREADFKANIPNKFIKRIYAEIKYFCAHKEKGCGRSDLSCFQIASHEEACEFNPDRIVQCAKCQEKFGNSFELEHDCVKGLSERNKKLCERVVELENEIKSLKEAKIEKTEFEGLVEEYSYLAHTLNLHRHILVKTKKKNHWRCNACTALNGSPNSFYCLECDVDLCNNCFLNSTNKNAKNHNHSHELSVSVKEIGQTAFVCDICKGRNDKFMLRFRCKLCDWDVCFKCRY